VRYFFEPEAFQKIVLIVYPKIFPVQGLFVDRFTKVSLRGLYSDLLH